uniref:Ig-like domain-containing protein n=1 Tax=Salarias fasciatus TaxID=181472 RepID=A0A672GJU6_SALFA
EFSHSFLCSPCFVIVFVSAAVSTETVVGVAGQAATLPCRSEAVEQPGVEVCWGTGEPSLFGCHNTVMYSAGSRVTYRKSHRYTSTGQIRTHQTEFSVSSSSSLSISDLRQSDSGFYHCRVQLPGLFNDETSSVHLIIVLRTSTPPTRPRPSPSASETPQLSDGKDQRSLNAPQTTAAQEQSGEHTALNLPAVMFVCLFVCSRPSRSSRMKTLSRCSLVTQSDCPSSSSSLRCCSLLHTVSNTQTSGFPPCPSRCGHFPPLSSSLSLGALL